MKKLSQLKLFGFVFILIGVLILIGINSLEAKRPAKPENWKVEIPIKSIAEQHGWNLYGTNGGIYESVDDFVYVKTFKTKYRAPSPPTDVKYSFQLLILKTWEPECYQLGQFNTPGLYTIGFQDVNLTDVEFGDGDPYHFPLECSGLPASPLEPTAYYMACFLNNFLHPSWYECVDRDGEWKKNGYRYINLFVNIFYDIERFIQDGDQATVPGGVIIKESTGYVLLPDDNELYHDVIGINSAVGSLQAEVARDGDTWTITFVDQPLKFKETYKELVGELKRKGKSHNYDYSYVEYTPITASTYFSFQTKWTRIK